MPFWLLEQKIYVHMLTLSNFLEELS